MTADPDLVIDEPDEPDHGDNLSGVLTLIRRAVLEPGGDTISGALTLMRDELERVERERAEG